MVNHLYRGSAEGRHEQSRLLNMWAAGQDKAVIAVGDFNYDVNANNPSNRDEGFDLLTEDNVFTWARPDSLVRTQCSFNSVLDFVFTAGEAKNWRFESLIDARTNDCPDDANRSDHRPINTTFTMSSVNPSPNINTITQPQTNPRNSRNTREILERIRVLERELRELRQAIERP